MTAILFDFGCQRLPYRPPDPESVGNRIRSYAGNFGPFWEGSDHAVVRDHSRILASPARPFVPGGRVENFVEGQSLAKPSSKSRFGNFQVLCPFGERFGHAVQGKMGRSASLCFSVVDIFGSRRGGKCHFQRPVLLDSVPEAHAGYADFRSPVGEDHCTAVEGDVAVASSVPSLSSGICPEAVIGSIVAFVVAAFDCVFAGRSEPHVRQEVAEVLEPSFTDCNASPPVPFVFRVIGVVASSLHVAPAAVFGAVAHTMTVFESLTWHCYFSVRDHAFMILTERCRLASANTQHNRPAVITEREEAE